MTIGAVSSTAKEALACGRRVFPPVAAGFQPPRIWPGSMLFRRSRVLREAIRNAEKPPSDSPARGATSDNPGQFRLSLSGYVPPSYFHPGC